MTDVPAEAPAAATARALIEGLVSAGLRHVCISPGSRSGPLALAAARHPGLTTTVHLDERGAGFFALGWAKSTGVPAAVICTSGTAAANLLPAAVEARYSATPLILITADRPPELRDTGAWQTINQVGLFGTIVRWAADLPAAETASESAVRVVRSLGARALATAVDAAGPVHLNVPLREPLIGPSAAEMAAVGSVDMEKGAGATRTWTGPRTVTEAAVRTVADRIRATPHGLIVAGTMPPRHGTADAIWRLAAASGYPILADATSNARFGAGAECAVVSAAEAILRTAWAGDHAPNLVLRFGASPVWRPVNEYLASAREVITVDPHGLWDDPNHQATERIVADPEWLADALAKELGALGDPERSAWREAWLEADGVARLAALARVGPEPGSPGGGSPAAQPLRNSVWVAAAIEAGLPEGAQLWLANSMSVREFDSFGRSAKRIDVLVNRGAAGIDGTLSSALGAAAATGAPTVLLCGDLAFIHDLNALAGADQVGAPIVIVVVNDDGGGIFAYLGTASEPEFERVFRVSHSADLGVLSRGFGAGYATARTPEELTEALAAGLDSRNGDPGRDLVTVVEVQVDMTDNTDAHRQYWAAVARALDRSTT